MASSPSRQPRLARRRGVRPAQQGSTQPITRLDRRDRGGRGAIRSSCEVWTPSTTPPYWTSSPCSHGTDRAESCASRPGATSSDDSTSRSSPLRPRRQERLDLTATRSGGGTPASDGHRGGGVRPSRRVDRRDVLSELGQKDAVVDVARAVGVDDSRSRKPSTSTAGASCSATTHPAAPRRTSALRDSPRRVSSRAATNASSVPPSAVASARLHNTQLARRRTRARYC